jgi:hypothetical protein
MNVVVNLSTSAVPP